MHSPVQNVCEVKIAPGACPRQELWYGDLKWAVNNKSGENF